MIEQPTNSIPTCQAFRFAPSCDLIATKRTPRGVLVCPACAAWMDNILTRAGVAERCEPIDNAAPAHQIDPGSTIAPAAVPEYHPTPDRRATARFSGSDDDWPDTIPVR